MPFLEPRPIIGDLTNFAPADDIELDPSLAETFSAAFRTQNTIGSWLASRGTPDPYRIEEGFNAIDYVKDEQEFAPHVEEFSGIFNKPAADAKKLQIRREMQDRRTLDAAGLPGIAAQMATGVFDLPTLLPLGGPVAGMFRTTGSMALAIGGAAALDAGVSEAALQATQATRTRAETALNIGGSIVLGGALGALVGRYLKPGDISTLSRKIEGQEAAFEEFDRGFSTLGRSVGAAARDTGPLTLKDEKLISSLPLVNRQDPLIRAQLSELDEARIAVRGLAETPLEYADNARGVATERGGSVETRMKMWRAPEARTLRGIDTAYASYFHGAPEPTAWQTRLAPIRSEWARRRGGDKLTYKQFKEEVGIAAFSGEQHAIPEVAQAAKLYREVDEAVKKAAIEAKLLPEDVTVAGDVSHIFRMYDKNRIVARRSEFGARLQDYFITARDAAAKADAAIAKADAAVKKVNDAEAEFARLSDAEIKSLVDETIDTILGHAEGRVPYDIVAGPRGPLKERLLRIESAKIQDFIEKDIETVLRAQMRTMSADIEIAKKFGDVEMKEVRRKINDEANAKIAKATTEKERTRLDVARKDAIRDLEGIRDRLRGTYAMPSDPNSLVVRVGRIARNLNYMRLLGGMTLSALPDMAKVVFTHGLTSTFKDGFLPMIRNFKAARLAMNETKLAGTALDMILDSRTMAMADITDDFGRHSKFERGLTAMSSKFGMVSLMAPWNAAMKQFAGLVTMTNVLKASERLAKGTASADDIRKLAASGIDEDLAQRIAKQFAEHGENRDGVFLAQTEGWTDRGAIEAFRAAIVRDVDRIIVTPGQDKPLWMSTELGKAVGQFKSFFISSMQRTMLSGIQQRDAATLNGAMLMLGLGAMTYAIKEKTAGRELSDNPGVWAVNALDWSGLTGWLMEVNNISEKATRGRAGFSALTGEQVSRYQTRNIYGTFLGPSADAVADIFQISGSIFAGDTTKSDLRRARMLVPGQNLFYIRQMLDHVEKATGESLGLPDRRQ